MVFGVFDFDRQESSGADMQGQENLFDAFFIQSLQDARGKMQAGGRCGNGTLVSGIDGLIIFFVVIFVPQAIGGFFAFDIRRQRH